MGTGKKVLLGIAAVIAAVLAVLAGMGGAYYLDNNTGSAINVHQTPTAVSRTKPVATPAVNKTATVPAATETPAQDTKSNQGTNSGNNGGGAKSGPTSVMEICPKCQGTGKYPCATCGGTGQVICWVCNGSQFIQCSRCGGKGGYIVGGDMFVQCEDCGHTGHVICILCGGTVFVKCPQCPDGKVKCPYCDGKGQHLVEHYN